MDNLSVWRVNKYFVNWSTEWQANRFEASCHILLVTPINLAWYWEGSQCPYITETVLQQAHWGGVPFPSFQSIFFGSLSSCLCSVDWSHSQIFIRRNWWHILFFLPSLKSSPFNPIIRHQSQLTLYIWNSSAPISTYSCFVPPPPNEFYLRFNRSHRLTTLLNKVLV